MLQREDIEVLLAEQARAYALLMWLGDQARTSPEWLGPAAIEALKKPLSAREWTLLRRESIPGEWLGAEPLQESFWRLFSSFFETSFRVTHLDFGDVLLDSSIKTGVEQQGHSTRGVDGAVALAIKHLAGSEHIFVTPEQARRLAKRSNLREPSLVWAYVWELDRRARGKGKGPVSWMIWRALPRSTRKELDVERVWQARSRLIEAAKATLEA
ncbi:MAG: hypothetical protein U0165_11825 [Polyangiaceae bacterium]